MKGMVEPEKCASADTQISGGENVLFSTGISKLLLVVMVAEKHYCQALSSDF